MEPDKGDGGTKLASCMLELGYSCTSDEIVFRGVTRRCPAIDEQAVAEVLGVLARTHTGLSADQLGGFVGLGGSGPDAAASQWNYSVVIEVVKSLKPDLNWHAVAERFDHEGFLVPDAPGFALLSAAYKRGAGEQVPVKAVLGRMWRNAMGQLSLLRQATAAPPDVYSFEGAERKLAPVEGLQGGRSSSGTPNHAWLSIDLYEVLRALTDAGHFAAVRTILEQPAKNCPEVSACARAWSRSGAVGAAFDHTDASPQVRAMSCMLPQQPCLRQVLILGVAAVPGEWGLMQREVCGALLPLYLGNASPNSHIILTRLWGMNQVRGSCPSSQHLGGLQPGQPGFALRPHHCAGCRCSTSISVSNLECVPWLCPLCRSWCWRSWLSTTHTTPHASTASWTSVRSCRQGAHSSA